MTHTTTLAVHAALRYLASLLLLVALPLCSVASAADVVVWHSYRSEEKAAIEKVAAAYNASHAGSHVTTLAVPFDAFADKISAAVPRGKGPDVFIYAQDRLGGWIEAGNTVEPIDFFLDDATRARFLPTTMQAMTYRGQVFGLPLNYKVITLIYNKKLVTTPPRDTAELVKLARSLTDKASGRFGLAYAYSDYYYHAALQNGFGGGVFEKGSKPVLNRPENLAALELLMRWLDKDGFLPAEPSTALITALFNEGKAAMIFNGPWFLGEISKDVKYGLALLPRLTENGGAPLRPWMTVEGVYVSARSANKEAAYDFARYITDVAAGKTMAIDGRQSPANKAVYSDPQVAADPVLKAFKQQVDVAVPMPNLPEMTMVWSPATTMMNAVTKHGATPKAGLDTAQAAVAKDVAQLRKK
jgi:arabinogalactan oligomer/maltooligosaccharide transport system substrate-binding protein